MKRFTLLLLCVLLTASSASAQVAGQTGKDDLAIVAGGKTMAIVVVAADAGEWEKRAAEDLAHYIERMTGAKPALANTVETASAALKGATPVLVVGKAAIAAEPGIAGELQKVVKQEPVIRADAIVVRRNGNRVYLAGNNDDAHYYAVASLLRDWGCRWYLPGDIGECIPKHAELTVGTLNTAYAPPFEVRRYWLSWNGDATGKPEFMRRNFFNDVLVPNGHHLATYTKDLIPPGKTMFNVPISEDRTAEHVAKQLVEPFKKGEDIMLGLEDGIYESESKQDKELIALQYDKYFLTQSYTDAFMTFYNKTSELLLKEAPNSKSRIGFLIYSNITLPPVRVKTAARPLVGYLAPIDIDPIHSMDDPRSGPRQEYKDMLTKWAKVMEGRLVIYDYDQSMLVWRDLPNPSHQAFCRDVQHYRKAGILGVDTESRGAMATILLNLHLRGQLLWNPDADCDGMIEEFYTKFYGHAAPAMGKYWNAIFKAWAETVATEHEYFVAPVVYTPELMAELRKQLEAATSTAAPHIAGDQQLAQRMKFTQLSFNVLEHYMNMVRAAANEVDYKAAVAAGERGLAAREELTALNGTFTTYKMIGENGYAWWPGEVQQYKELLPLVDGTQGTLLAKLPLVWNFRRDPKNVGEKEAWQKQAVDLTWWNSLKQPVSLDERRNNPGHWEQVRSDIYLQGQGVITADYQSYTGHGWYQIDLELPAEQTQGKVHLKFPGLFNECWLYVNGEQVAHRPFKGVWWMNDYRFEWDVDLAGKLKQGKNSIVLRINNPHHLGGMFRRPFLWREN